eukprot:1139648-Pelagomonas_calceolata.AAC.2
MVCWSRGTEAHRPESTCCPGCMLWGACTNLALPPKFTRAHKRTQRRLPAPTRHTAHQCHTYSLQASLHQAPPETHMGKDLHIALSRNSSGHKTRHGRPA